MTIDEEIFEDMLHKVEQGMPLKSIAQTLAIPDMVLLQTYLRQNPSLMERYRTAKKTQKRNLAINADLRQASIEERRSLLRGR